MDKIISFFTTKFGFWALAGALAFASATVTVKHIQLLESRRYAQTLQASLATCAANLATSQNNESVLTSAIASQNAGIGALEAKSRLLATHASTASNKALLAGEKRKSDAARLGSGPDVMNVWMREVYK